MMIKMRYEVISYGANKVRTDMGLNQSMSDSIRSA